ncbi:hypothetical protein B0A48_00709 [Cryoendolithus antarcticus]|uniref:Uncharacterized protein n=1 Tax=Cryoendolithus antarcticus TaxID=1507870 RepID=A0A1V8TVG3_9PEZI|nr:hypothetical protein B0A48_00709 [Cryoendolithus antarcticus]
MTRVLTFLAILFAMVRAMAIGVGISLSFDYGTVSVAYPNRTVDSVLRVDGDEGYRTMMRNQTWTRPQDEEMYYTPNIWEPPSFPTQVTRLEMRQSCVHPPNSALHGMLEQLKTAVVTHTGADMDTAHIVFPLNPSISLTTALEHSTRALNIRELSNMHWATIAAAYYLSDLRDSGCDRENVLLTVDYSRAGIIATLSGECYGMTWPQRTFFDLNPVIAGTNITDTERIVTLFNTLISHPITDWDGENLHGLDKIVLMGELGNTPEIRTMLRQALDAGPSGGVLEDKLVHQESPNDPLFVASAGAAMDSMLSRQPS